MATSSPEDLDIVTRLAFTGSEDGTYSVLNTHNVKTLMQAEIAKTIATSPEKSLGTIKRLRKIFQERCYLRKDSIFFVLACIVRNSIPHKDHKDDVVREEAYKLAGDMCETAKELFTFVHLDKCVSSSQPCKVSWGRGMRALVRHFYESKSPLRLAKEVTSCKSARGFRHRDLIRQCHLEPSKKGKGTAAVLGYLTHGKEELTKFEDHEDREVQEVVTYLKAVASLGSMDLECERELVRSVVETHSLQATQMPTQCLMIKEGFEGLLNQMPLVDLFRAVPKMASLGVLEPSSSTLRRVVEKMSDVDAVKADGTSPVVIFSCQKKYELNRGKKWVRNQDIINAFNTAYKASLQVLPKTGGRHLLALHVSPKVTKVRVLGSSWLSPVMLSAVMVQMLLQTEDQVDVVFFSSEVTEIKVNKDMATVSILEHLLKPTKEANNAPFDLCTPLTWASNSRKPYDNILLLTDTKTVSSVAAFHQAVRQYRSSCVPEARVAVVGLSDATNLSDPNDLCLLDVSGCNETVPIILHRFFKGVLDQFSSDPEHDS